MSFIAAYFHNYIAMETAATLTLHFESPTATLFSAFLFSFFLSIQFLIWGRGYVSCKDDAYSSLYDSED